MRAESRSPHAAQPGGCRRSARLLAATAQQRHAWLAACETELSSAGAAFWKTNADTLARVGAIWCGRYEQFILKLHWIIRPLLGRAFKDLASCTTMEQQQAVFDCRIGPALLRALLRLAFSRKVYAGHGIDQQGLINRETTVPLGEQYWSKLRAFCTSTPARENPWLQIHTLGRLLTMQAAPIYFTGGLADVRESTDKIDWIQSDLLEYVQRSLPATVTAVYLSNLPDWNKPEAFEQLITALARKLPAGSRVAWSYLHTNWQLPALLSTALIAQHASPLPDRFPLLYVQVLRSRATPSQETNA